MNTYKPVVHVLPPTSSPSCDEHMAFRIETSAEAELDAAGILEWLTAQQAGQARLRWFLDFEQAIASLSTLPERCPLAPENTRIPFDARTHKDVSVTVK